MKCFKQIAIGLFVLLLTACTEKDIIEKDTAAKDTVVYTVSTVLETTSVTTVTVKDAAQTETSVSEHINESAQDITRTDNTTSDAISETGVVKEFSDSVKTLASVYTRAVCDKISHLEDKYDYYPVGYAPDDTAGMRGSCSKVYLIDFDFDDVPELFTGRTGSNGGGVYDIFESDGTLLGKDIAFCADPSLGSVVDNVMYMPSCLSAYPGTVALKTGFPAIHVNGNVSEVDNTVIIDCMDGEQKQIDDVSFVKYTELYPEYLGVEYDALDVVSEYAYVADYLRVPDPDNYTEDDIYNCLASLLAEYEAQAAD